MNGVDARNDAHPVSEARPVSDPKDVNDLAQAAADQVITVFNNISAGKPTIRSNGVPEWTVLASVVLIFPNGLVPVTIATGVKALPDRVRTYSNGRIVHDMHAEILALRGFNKFLLDQLNNKLNQKGDKKANHSTDKNQFDELLVGQDKFRLNPEVKVALVVTELPCGDASMELIKSQAKDGSAWKSSADTEIKSSAITRGRAGFDDLGVVRTKPGRADSVQTLSKSCSDKLCLKQLTGINNCITSSVISPIFLDYLILPQGRFKWLDIDRSFNRRFCVEGARKFKVLLYTLRDYPYVKHPDAEPSPLALVYINGQTQVLNNGVKNGGYVKNKCPKPGNESVICNHRMYQMIGPSVEYDRFKRSQRGRELVKERGRLVLGHWMSTTKDDFE